MFEKTPEKTPEKSGPHPGHKLEDKKDATYNAKHDNAKPTDSSQPAVAHVSKDGTNPDPADVEAAKQKQGGPSAPSGNHIIWWAMSKEGEEWFLWKKDGNGKTEHIEQSHSPNVILERLRVEGASGFESLVRKATEEAQVKADERKTADRKA